jgi:hypothetical protein
MSAGFMLNAWFLSILFKCITLQEIAVLDSALCNRNMRKRWLKLLAKVILPDKITKPLLWNGHKIHWFLMKGLVFNELWVEDGFNNIPFNLFAELVPQLKKVKAIYIKPFFDISDTYEAVMNICHGFTIPFLFAGDASKEFPLLSELRLFGLPHDAAVSIAACKSIKSMHIDFAPAYSIYWILNGECGKNLENLKMVKYYQSVAGKERRYFNLLRTIGHNCANIQILDIGDILKAEQFPPFTLDCALYLLDSCPKLHTYRGPFSNHPSIIHIINMRT